MQTRPYQASHSGDILVNLSTTDTVSTLPLPNRLHQLQLSQTTTLQPPQYQDEFPFTSSFQNRTKTSSSAPSNCIQASRQECDHGPHLVGEYQTQSRLRILPQGIHPTTPQTRPHPTQINQSFPGRDVAHQTKFTQITPYFGATQTLLGEHFKPYNIRSHHH